MDNGLEFSLRYAIEEFCDIMSNRIDDLVVERDRETDEGRLRFITGEVFGIFKTIETLKISLDVMGIDWKEWSPVRQLIHRAATAEGIRGED